MATVAGYGDAQIANAAIIADVAYAWGLGDRGALLGVMCAMGESSLRNIDYGDWETNGVRNPDGSPTTSIGLFQQQTWWGTPAERMDPRYAAWAFFDRLVKVRDWQSIAPTLAIHRVQINADPNHYDRYETPARAVLAWIAARRAEGTYMPSAFDIIEVPWQPGAYGRRALVELVAKALGKPRINSMLRLRPEQQRARDLYLAGKGSPADDPNRPDLYELGHVRGIAVDIDATADNVRRLLAVGLVRPFSYEPWHFRIPGSVQPWSLVDAIPASLEAKPFEEDDSMSAADVAELKAHINSQFANFLQVPGTLYGYPQSTEQKVDALSVAVARVASGQIFYPGEGYYMAPALANAAREDNNTAPVVQVSEEAIVQAIVPLLPAHVGKVPDADLDRIVAAASAERARRAESTGS